MKLRNKARQSYTRLSLGNKMAILESATIPGFKRKHIMNSFFGFEHIIQAFWGAIIWRLIEALASEVLSFFCQSLDLFWAHP